MSIYDGQPEFVTPTEDDPRWMKDRIAELEGVQKVLVEEAKARGARIAQLEEENAYLKGEINHVAESTGNHLELEGYHHAIADVLALLGNMRWYSMQDYSKAAQKIEALRGGGE